MTGHTRTHGTHTHVTHTCIDSCLLLSWQDTHTHTHTRHTHMYRYLVLIVVMAGHTHTCIDTHCCYGRTHAPHLHLSTRLLPQCAHVRKGTSIRTHTHTLTHTRTHTHITHTHTHMCVQGLYAVGCGWLLQPAHWLARCLPAGCLSPHLFA